jgi:hypothetical protein
VIKGDEILTYGEWNERADRVPDVGRLSSTPAQGLRHAAHSAKAALVVSEQRSPTRILASRAPRSIISQTYLVKGSFSVSQ